MTERKRNPEPLNAYEQLSLLKQPNPRAPTGLRNLCLISLMLKTGLRVNEIVNLRTNDLDWHNAAVRIRASGAACERMLSIDHSELSLMKSWNEIRPSKSEYFFNTLDGSRLKDRYIREMIKRLARKAGINKDVYPHLLRYTFAVDFMREVGDLKLLQEALGHRDPAATQIYTSLLFDSGNNSCDEGQGVKRSGMPLGSYRDSGENMTDSEGVCITAALKSPQKRPDSLREENGIFVGRAEVDRANKSIKAEPVISIEVESEPERTKIPAIKCSRCSFILHYQGDCPQCGANFKEIMNHWGKIW